jgi:hypothetical protein
LGERRSGQRGRDQRHSKPAAHDFFPFRLVAKANVWRVAEQDGSQEESFSFETIADQTAIAGAATG